MGEGCKIREKLLLGQKYVKKQFFGQNFRFFMKIAHFRQSHYQPEWYAKFQRKSIFWTKKLALLSTARKFEFRLNL